MNVTTPTKDLIFSSWKIIFNSFSIQFLEGISEGQESEEIFFKKLD